MKGRNMTSTLVHDELKKLREENQQMKMLLDDLKAEFAAVYAETPPVFQGRWARVARLLGVEA